MKKIYVKKIEKVIRRKTYDELKNEGAFVRNSKGNLCIKEGTVFEVEEEVEKVKRVIVLDD